MSEDVLVVVFPSIFTKNRRLLALNIRKILKIQNQKFGRITYDNPVITVEATDPVFASSAISHLFGISQISIAKQVENKFDVIVSAIVKIGTNLLLQGEQFYIKVEGISSGYLPKDLEIAATSVLIEKTIDIGCKPGSEQRHDKLIHCFLTKKNAYISIFVDRGHGGIPYNSQEVKSLCCIYDEISAVSCLELIKQGFDTRIVLCYDHSRNLLELVKIVNRIIPKMLSSEITLDLVQIPKQKLLQKKILTITQILCHVAKKEKIQMVSLSLSPLMFPVWFIEQNAQVVQKNGLTPWITLAGLDDSMIETAKDIGLGKYLDKIEVLAARKFLKVDHTIDFIDKALQTRQTLSVKLGPNNIHDILDSLNQNRHGIPRHKMGIQK